MTTHVTRLAFFAAIFLTASARADVKLPAIFGSNMVLQRDKPIAIWGWADAGEEVTVTLGDSNTAKAKPGADGKWTVKLAAMKATAAAGDGMLLTVKGKNTLTLSNVLVGEVWVCSGQSNMAWTLRQSDGADQAIASSSVPAIRLITVPRVPIDKPQSDFNGKWEVCGPTTSPTFSGVAYFFGRELHQHLNVPIGLINTSFGGTAAEAWTSRAALESEASLKPLLEEWDKRVQEQTPEKVLAQNQAALKKWQDAVTKAKEEKKEPPAKPRPLVEAKRNQNRPANLYNGMIAPLVGLSFRGVIWYQGEGNVPRAHQYRTLFPLMIKNWRTDFGNADMPFGFVQLAPFRYTRNDPAMCAELWEAQLHTLRTVPNTGMAVITDVGDVKDIHPTNKQVVGTRLALWARAKVYGEKDLVYSGPIPKLATEESGKIVMHFDHAGGLKSRDGKPLTHFEIAGEDRKFVPAEAVIEGETVVVSSKDVAKPLAVRYAWRDDAEPNLVNKDGLPATPFRTDNWKGVTEGKAY